jgi:hypothetical protein
VSEIKRLQQEQGKDQDQLVRMGMSTGATLPVTVSFLRQRQNDNVMGLGQLAQHQADAYHTWLGRLVAIDQYLFGALSSQRCLTSGKRGHARIGAASG